MIETYSMQIGPYIRDWGGSTMNHEIVGSITAQSSDTSDAAYRLIIVEDEEDDLRIRQSIV